jgi:cyclomaltodextrinase / maltogenic alpha-amylase / neopullulanase
MTKASIETPAWVRDAVFYQIFPDRFAKSEKVPKPENLETWESTPTHHGFKGGDLLGVVEHLDYLVDLGINAIYFNPIFASAANHRYHTYDYYNVDPILGGNAALRTLLDESHKRGIRVVLDGVFNHASRGFFQFHHLLENGPYSPYIRWFNVKAWPLNAYEMSAPPNYDAWWNLPALPAFNTDNEEVREFLFDVAEFWVKFGIDGWRLDVPAEIDDDKFWRTFRKRVKAANPEAYITGEIWHDARRWLKGDQFDAVMNYLFTKLCIEFFIGANADAQLVHGSSLWPIGTRTPQTFAKGIEELLDLYPREVTEVQLNLLDSHDTARYLTLARGDETALRLSTLMQMVYPGAPCIYYGDEVGMTGGKDPMSRGGFPWQKEKWNTDLRNYFKKCIALRHAHPALRTGEYTTLLAQDSVYALGRSLGDDKVIVAFNIGRAVTDCRIPLDDFLPDGTELCEVFKKDRYTVEHGAVTVHILPRSAVALEVRRET